MLPDCPVCGRKMDENQIFCSPHCESVALRTKKRRHRRSGSEAAIRKDERAKVLAEVEKAMEEQEKDVLTKLTQAVRQADDDFKQSGGSSRHWVIECFIPAMEQKGIKVINLENLRAAIADMKEKP